MERVLLQKQCLSPHFIGAWNLESSELCDGLVNYFEKNINKHKNGRTGFGLNHNIKKSVDIAILPNDIILAKNEILCRYIEMLFSCYKDYILQWPFLSTFATKVEIGSFNIQRYQAGEHFQQIHCERASISTLHRLFAWMTYLNDVDEGGTTLFSHYDLEIKPRKGLTLIWPAEWTHAHKGNILHSGSKYIVTGWMDLCV